MFLSILIPSKRPEGLESFLNTFRANTQNPSDIEIIALVDDDTNYVELMGNMTIIHQTPVKPVNVGSMIHECYKLSKGEWIFIANDDIKINTFDWDMILRQYINKYPDQLALFWPSDDLFDGNLSCFPIVSRKVLEGVGFFPVPYRRYRIDDTLYNMFPFNRRIFIPEIKTPHKNAIYTRLHGNEIDDSDGAIQHDSNQWVFQAQRREDMKKFFDPVRKRVKVLIGASTGEFPRRADFYDYMNMLEKPEGTILMYSHERSPAQARNQIIQQSIDYGCTHVLLVDDDQTFQPNALMQLLEHDVDIVSCLYFGRAWPHRPLIFDLAHDDGQCRYYTLTGKEKRLEPIVAAGFGFILMKTEIFYMIEKPWVRLGELDPEQWCDDIGFFKRARAAGIQSWCDTNCRVGHIGSMIIWPEKVNGQWLAVYDTGTGRINIPMNFEVPKTPDASGLVTF